MPQQQCHIPEAIRNFTLQVHPGKKAKLKCRDISTLQNRLIKMQLNIVFYSSIWRSHDTEPFNVIKCLCILHCWVLNLCVWKILLHQYIV